MKHFFIRVNGQTVHNNPIEKDCYVPGELTHFLRNGYSNYLSYCFENDIVRFGWPDVGDISKGKRIGAKANCYDLDSIKSYIRKYLLQFSDIQSGSILIVPDRDKSGDIYICEVVRTYWYETNGPYECAHRVGVKWDRDYQSQPILYTSEQLGISKGGWWLRAFQEIKEPEIITKIASIRERKFR
jgi:hypothetical protein